jgi:hypothetical protein
MILPDEEKKKYFKIQPNHTSRSGSQYSVDDVKRRKITKEAQKTEAIHKEATKNLIRRAPITNRHALFRQTLRREIGNSTRHEGARAAAQVLAGGWSAKEILSSCTYIVTVLNP